MGETKSSTRASGGIGFSGLLTIVFIVLKLTGYIDWAWWWVVSPIWIAFAISLVLVVMIILVSFVVAIVKR